MEEINVRTIRSHLKMTQIQLGVKLGVDTGTISRWERHLARPSRLAIRELLRLDKKAKK